MLVGVCHRSPFSISCGKWNKIECFQFPKLGHLCGRINLIHYIWVQRANNILPRSLLRIFPGHPLKKEGVSCTQDHYLPVSSFYRAFRADSGIHVFQFGVHLQNYKKKPSVYIIALIPFGLLRFSISKHSESSKVINLEETLRIKTSQVVQ